MYKELNIGNYEINLEIKCPRYRRFGAPDKIGYDFQLLKFEIDKTPNWTVHIHIVICNCVLNLVRYHK